MKGIILAGGKGTRLYPITKVISKQILPIYDKPMIYYPLSTLMMMGIKDILIISTPRDIGIFKELLGDGRRLGISICYAIQKYPKGIAESFIIGEDFIDNDRVALILGDNIFWGYRLEEVLVKAINNKSGATVFSYYVNNPKDFGIIQLDKDNNAISIEEKPKNPKSNLAVTGLYVYDKNIVDIAKSIKPSERGELEITAVNDIYLNQRKLKVQVMDKGIVWFDTGTNKSMITAANFVEMIQNTEGIYVGCPEEISYKKGYISREEILKLASEINNSDYKNYLLKCIGNSIY